MTEMKREEQDWKGKFEELIQLSIAACDSLRRKYPVRRTWSPEFSAWEEYLKKERPR